MSSSKVYLVKRWLSELINDKGGSYNWIEFLSTKKHYYNTIIIYRAIKKKGKAISVTGRGGP
jgi:hypothetical protein